MAWQFQVAPQSSNLRFSIEEEYEMVSQDLLDILRCPACVRNGPDAGLLDFIREQWLVCRDCDRKYPVRDGIPVMLIDEGDKYRDVPVEELGEP
jgi:uncharacterized protein YbaR (Trm112 family)